MYSIISELRRLLSSVFFVSISYLQTRSKTSKREKFPLALHAESQTRHHQQHPLLKSIRPDFQSLPQQSRLRRAVKSDGLVKEVWTYTFKLRSLMLSLTSSSLRSSKSMVCFKVLWLDIMLPPFDSSTSEECDF